MKLTIGFVGVLMVLLAVIASICFLNLTRVTATLIIIEVVPFLVLAVGVDNLFIMVHSYEVSSTLSLPPHSTNTHFSICTVEPSAKSRSLPMLVKVTSVAFPSKS